MADRKCNKNIINIRENIINMKILYIIAGLLLITFCMLCFQKWTMNNEGFVDTGRCGPNLGVCPAPLRCINGYCKTDIAPTLPYLSELPVVPPRYTSELTPQQQFNMHMI